MIGFVFVREQMWDCLAEGSMPKIAIDMTPESTICFSRDLGRAFTLPLLANAPLLAGMQM
tara:strand:- start:75 stop:254 length:180 start_codon:yes stop_codon:yes gene_type:complete